MTKAQLKQKLPILVLHVLAKATWQPLVEWKPNTWPRRSWCTLCASYEQVASTIQNETHCSGHLAVQWQWHSQHVSNATRKMKMNFTVFGCLFLRLLQLPIHLWTCKYVMYIYILNFFIVFDFLIHTINYLIHTIQVFIHTITLLI